MNNNAKKWVEELKSGKWNQTIGRLCRDTKQGEAYCCLGVACEVAIANGVEIEKKKEPLSADETLGGVRSIVYYGEDASSLPTEVQRWLGLKNPNGGFYTEYTDKDGYKISGLIGANDEMRYTFTQIADLIEAKQDDLFKEEE